MAKPATVKIKLVSTADTGFFCVDEEKCTHPEREAEASGSTTRGVRERVALLEFGRSNRCREAPDGASGS